MTQHTVNGGITRLAQMNEHDRLQLDALDEQWRRLMSFARANLEESRKGIDDLAVLVGIIEPAMPLMPLRVPTGPEQVIGSGVGRT